MKKKNVIIKEDRISELPELIVENILLRLVSPKDRVRVSVLSKRWCALTASFPFLDFNFDEFVEGVYGTKYHKFAIYLFYKYVEHSLSRFCCQKNVKNAHTFKLFTVVGNYEEPWPYIIDTCLESILRKGVKALEIMTSESTYRSWHNQQAQESMYRLPDIITSASSLTSLKVYHCMLPSSFMVDVPNFKSLKVLWLNNVRLDPLVIKHLTAASCPLLEELIVEYCYGIEKFCVYGRLQNLKKAHFFFNEKINEFERIDIEAPNLCEFQLCATYREGSATSVNLGLCKQLRTLCLRGSFFPTYTGLSDFLSNFPILENLSLSLASSCNGLALSSASFNSDEIIKFDSSESNARMRCHIIDEVNTLWFQKLRRFLEESDRFKVLNVDNRYHSKISVDFEQLKVIQLPPYELEHVKLERWLNVFMPEFSVVDGILWCCRPRSLSVTSKFFSSISYKERSHILKFISAKLLQQEDKDQTNIRIEWSFPSKDKIYLSWKSMMPELRYHNEQTVTFIKEEVVRKKKRMKPSKLYKC